MLLLLKPWRNLSTDLKLPDESWQDALDKFLAGAPKKIHDIIQGIQYFHECRNAAASDKSTDLPIQPNCSSQPPQRVQDIEGELELEEDAADPDDMYTQEGLAQLLASQESFREKFHGRMAVEHAKQAEIFCEELTWTVQKGSVTVGPASGNDLAQLQNWKKQMMQDVNNINASLGQDAPTAEQAAPSAGAAVSQDNVDTGRPQVYLEDEHSNGKPEAALLGLDPTQLLPD
ncbi:hypothetical protein CERSUDRAFT_92932 [Gelatoporia subvermispora B]|uniref:Uncharacterized protein n=1 Tax=Ceriporiopsis subvermispora (strain B) TaxID=914234 RepID=M2RK96_CERS8|nr:hypothetical protein CERSUDRAFT_92932 [Gelatoporia subvermispora B]